MKPNPGRLLIWGLIILVCSAFEVEAADVTLAWDPSSSPNVAGYRLHSGTTSGVYSQTSELGNATSTLVSNLVTGKTYFFVVTAYNTMGVESARSNEVSYLAPPTTVPEQMVSPTPGSTFTSSSVTAITAPRSRGNVLRVTEIDIGDGSFESLRRAVVARVHREPTPKEEAKLRELADRIQTATEEERIAFQKLSDAMGNSSK